MITLFKSALFHKDIIWSLAKNDIRSRYLGSYLGIFWFFVLPLVNLTVIWFAFEFGFRTGLQSGVPIILWLITGMVPWAFFSEAILSTASSIVEKPFLVKKIIFNIEFLPLIKIVASTVSFVCLSSFMILVFLLYDFSPSIYWLQLPYYGACLFALVLSFSWFNSSVVVFYRDMGQIISVGIQVGFWLTPIVWSPAMLPERLRFINILNPMAYIISGFRGSFIERVWFWEKPLVTLYFWLLVLTIFTLGLWLFRRLRPHFADLL